MNSVSSLSIVEKHIQLLNSEKLSCFSSIVKYSFVIILFDNYDYTLIPSTLIYSKRREIFEGIHTRSIFGVINVYLKNYLLYLEFISFLYFVDEINYNVYFMYILNKKSGCILAGGTILAIMFMVTLPMDVRSAETKGNHWGL